MENYIVTPSGVQLPEGQTFQAHGHINIKITTADGQYIRDAGIHFDPNNGHPGGQFIGQSFYPVDLADGECIGWVQVHGFNYHFGESGERPICETETPVIPEPQPDPLFRDNVMVGEPNCEAGTITTVTTNESAGYYLGNDGQWWLGEYFPTGDPITTVEAIAEGVCPAEQVITCPPGKAPGWLDENGRPTSCVDDNPTPGKPKDEAPTLTTIPTAPVAVQTVAPELAETGASDVLGGLVLAAVVLVTGGAALRRKAVIR